MATKLEELKALKDQAVDLQKQIDKKLRPVFNEGVKQLFVDVPNLVEISWIAYTPYFNDGDSCTFSSMHQDATINGASEWGDEDEERTFPKLSEEEQKKVTDFLSIFDDDDMESMFGDHIKVIVTKDKVETEDYEHD